MKFPDGASAHPGYDSVVMAGLVPAIHAFGRAQDVDARDKSPDQVRGRA
jgi:hypothetical protein